MNKKGFTLIELLAVIVIIGIIGGIAIVSIRSVVKTGDEKYFNALESNVLLAGQDYFTDHRDQLPTGNFYREVTLTDLVNNKYVEQPKDSKGNACSSGMVYVYRENNKYVYEVCLTCGGYESEGTHCKEVSQRNINMKAWLKGTSTPYTLTSYTQAETTRNTNVIVEFSMDDRVAMIYKAVNTKTNEEKSCNRGDNTSCTVEIENSGTYKVTAYDLNNQIVATNQYFNVKIAKTGPQFSVVGINTVEGQQGFMMDETESVCKTGGNTKQVSFKIVKDNINEEYKYIKYRAIRDGEVADSIPYENATGLEISKELSSGKYQLQVVVANQANDESTQTYDFYIGYEMTLQYEDDNSTQPYHVVTGQNYNFISTETLPVFKNLPGSGNVVVKWHPDNTTYTESNEITGETIVTNTCKYKIKGLLGEHVPIPSDLTQAYCNTLVDNETTQTLTKTVEGLTFTKSDGTAPTGQSAGTYNLIARVNSPQYIWSDLTTRDIPFTCTIAKPSHTITLNNQGATTAGTATIYEKYNVGWYNDYVTTTAITTITKPAKTGHTFGGYYTETGGSGTEIIDTSGSIVASNTQFSANATIYAKWTINIYTLTLDNQSATTAGTTAIYEKYGTGWYSNSGATTSITSITVPARTGYTFGGYYTSTNGGGTQIINASGTINASNTAFTSSTTLYAKWTPIICTVTLNNQSATTAGTSTIYEKYNTGWYSNSGATTSITSITKPAKTGHTYGGYYTSTGGSGTQIINASGSIVGANTAFTANTTLYAKWTANSYTITLNNQSATTAGTASVTATYGSAMPSITVPKREYTITYNYNGSGASNTTAKSTYTFGGYYTATSGGGTQYLKADGTSAKNSDFTAATTLYAKWTSAAVTLPTPTRTGYTFSGWYDAATDGTKIGNGGASYTPTANKTLYAHWAKNTYKININKNGSACTDCSGYTIHLSTSTSSDTSSYSGTTTTSSSVTISLASEAKHYIWIGKDQNHKSTMVYSGVAIEGKTASATVNYYTLTMSGTNMASLTLNGTTVSSGGSVVVAGTSGNSHTLGGSATSGYTFTAWSKVSGTVTFGDTATLGSALKVSASSSIKASAEDKTAPTVTLTSTATLKKTSQTATLKCTDGVGVTAYYWGTTEPTAATDVTTTTAADLTSLKSSSGLSKTISADGTYWLACKDAKGNYAKQKVIMRKYIVKNMLVTYSGTLGTYDTTNYAQASTGTYYVPNGTVLTVSSIYTIPTGSRSGRYRGYSTGAPSTTAVASLTSGNPTISANTTYAFWFSRNTVTFKYKTNGGTVKTPTKTSDGNTTYTWTVDSDGFINRATNGGTSAVYTTSYRYGVETINLPSPVYSYNLLILKSGKWVTTDKEWQCISGCTTASLAISEAATQTYNSSTMCDMSSADCVLVLNPRFVNCQANYYCTGSAVRASCGDGKSSVAGSTASSACFNTVKSYSATGCTSSSSSSTQVTEQTFTAPAAGKYKLEVWGAQGGKGSISDSAYGGKGGYSIGTTTLTKGQVLYVYVGCRGNTPWGGNNGGGSGTQEAGISSGRGGGGGGATHIATTSRGVLKNYASYKSEVLIVAGGGGGTDEAGDHIGGYGGGTSGGNGEGGTYPGKGATQTAIGARGDTDCTNAGWGYGGSSPKGNTTSRTYGVGGGGGGYYGGGAASHKTAGESVSASGGGGGSGWVSSSLTSTSTKSNSRTGHGYVTITWQGAA